MVGVEIDLYHFDLGKTCSSCDNGIRKGYKFNISARYVHSCEKCHPDTSTRCTLITACPDYKT